MASQQFSLKWHSHCQHLANSFNILRNEDEFLTDVTLCCEGKRLRAHKIILSVCSTYFRETFLENPCKHPVVIFKNVKFDDLANIVEFMYRGEVSIGQETLSSFLHVAEMLQVRGLSENQEIVPEKSIIATQVNQPESLFISVPEGNKILLATPQNISNQQQTTTTNLIKSPIKIEQNPVQHIKTTFIDQSSIGGKRKRFTVKEARPAKIPANNTNTTATTAQQFIAEAVDNSFSKQEAVMVDENGKESVFEEVEYLTMKSSMPECNYVVSAIDNAEQSQDNIEEEMALMQETFEIIEEGKQQIGDEVGEEQTAALTSGDTTNETSKATEEKTGEETNSKWTQCQYCKLVITSVNLWRHVRTQHTSQPPRKCEYCKKTFKNKYSLREHVRISHESKQSATKAESENEEQATTTTTTAATTTTQAESTGKVIYLEKL
ncbi:hypothetical protein PVAND_010923 [Polypedilum vanderplanki]|uniref:Uncharacterized protein n=1 Tax=Polypedilum vanderplanki TaxID=319348 RepID=A0A9J6CIU7_POLVA|nr:hypothetical protein PVAND_010923 [Polypedilum vanderplanki]